MSTIDFIGGLGIVVAILLFVTIILRAMIDNVKSSARHAHERIDRLFQSVDKIENSDKARGELLMQQIVALCEFLDLDYEFDWPNTVRFRKKGEEIWKAYEFKKEKKDEPDPFRNARRYYDDHANED